MATSSLRAPARESTGFDTALLVLRLTLGILILLHGIAKLPPPPTSLMGMLAKANLPEVIAWGVYVARSSPRSCSSSACGRGWRRCSSSST